LDSVRSPSFISNRACRERSTCRVGQLERPTPFAVVFDDLHFRFREYNALATYAQSKTASALLAVAITRCWASDVIFSNACNPGAIATNLQRHTGGLKTPPEFHKTVEQGAATSVLLAASSLLEGIGGRFFENCNESPLVQERPTDFRPAVAPYALDAENAERLWSVAHGLSYPCPPKDEAFHSTLSETIRDPLEMFRFRLRVNCQVSPTSTTAGG
jgi:NAD(P)-dependent dehydrogenase (short-subunit alcohol dehydrogenase family)